MFLNKPIQTEAKFINFSFCENNQPVSNSPVCGMTLLAAGSMRFRWNEQNENRQNFFKNFTLNNPVIPVPVELIHSQIVYDVTSPEDVKEKTGDGIITLNKTLMPTVTVADCVPIYLWDKVTGVFGIVHSGWKGTGIVANAIKLAEEKYNSKVEDFLIVIGPHIRSCCYIVNEERASYFSEQFTSECVEPLEEGGKCYCGGKGLPVSWNNGEGKLYRLSLEKANLAVLKKIGVKEENISLFSDCTCCNEVFGSNRRQTANNEIFCVQAAYIYNRI